MQLLQLTGRNGAQAALDNLCQGWPVTPGGHPQQLRQSNIADHGQTGELGLDRQAAQLRLIDYRIARLLADQ